MTFRYLSRRSIPCAGNVPMSLTACAELRTQIRRVLLRAGNVFLQRETERVTGSDLSVINEEKLDLGRLIDRVHGMGLKFGIWYEPEMISPDSALFRAHPDWCVHVPGRTPSIARHQYVLDVSRPDVRENVFAQMCSVLGRFPIDYVKWDFNRNLSEAGSAQLSPETWHVLPLPAPV